MKKCMIAVLGLITGFSSNAQKGLDEMIAAEKAFAAYSVANNTKDAFLKFMDTSAIMFKDGEPYKAYEVWQKREKRPGVLNWRPRYAEISASGDFGWTAGPWTFQPKTINDSVVANAFFFTVWKKNSAGEWKFIFDNGTDVGQKTTDTSIIKFSLVKKEGGNLEEMLAAENAYIKQYEEDLVKAHKQFAAYNVIYAGEKSDLIDAHTADLVVDYGYEQTKAPGDKKFTPLGHGISATGDMGFIYGTVIKDKKESYLRIWRHEPKGWKIALQMMRLSR